MKRSNDRSAQKLARDALRRAAERPEPNVERLVEAVPGLIAEARRRRHVEERRDLVVSLVPLAGKLIPRLALATAVVLALALALFLTEGDGETDPDMALDRLILTGSANGGMDDPLLDAIVQEEGSDG